MTESDIIVEDEPAYNRQRENAPENDGCKGGMISNNYFNYQPVTLNQIEEAEESKASGSIIRPGGVTSFKDQNKGININQH